MKKTKQIGFISAIIIAVGATVGSGIFFKNDAIFSNAGGDLGFTIASWVIATIGIMAVGVALIEVSSAGKDDGGVLEWVRKFVPKKVAKYSAAYMVLIYMPLNYFAMPLWVVMAMQDAGLDISAWGIVGIGLAIFFWIAIMAFFSLKSAEKLQWVITVIKYIPLIVAPILAFAAMPDAGVVTNSGSAATPGLTGLSKWLGIFASIPAIIFAFDGFYVVTNMKSQLKEPKKIGRIVIVSIATIAISYLWYAISTGLIGATSPDGIPLVAQNKWLSITINSFIAIAVIGIVNGFALSAPRMYKSVYKNENIGIVSLVKKLFKQKDDLKASFLTSVLLAVVAFIVLVPISFYGMDNYKTGYTSYGQMVGPLYEMLDLVTNFTSLFVFMFMGFAIFGGIRNRKTNKVKVERYKYFVPAAVVGVIFIGIGVLYTFIEAIANMFMLDGADQTTAIVEFVILIGTAFIAAIPVIVKSIKGKRQPKQEQSKQLVA